jgi:group I intron endonuclease
MLFIYALIDPRDKSVKYIGVSKDVRRRYKEHLADFRYTKKAAWIRKMKRLGLVIKVKLIEICTNKNWKSRERYWIKYYSNNKLVNLTKGGEGIFGYRHSQKTKDRIGKASLGVKRSDETKEKLRVAALNSWSDDSFRARQIQKLIGNKRGKGRKGIKHTEESKQKMRDSIARRNKCH